MMPFQLTYAFKGSDEVYLVQLEVEEEDIKSAFKHALAYIVEQHGNASLEIIHGISILSS